MVKRLDSLYTPGRRGKCWLKIKPADNIDLVIIAADWGYGRRTGWLSNYHLAVIDERTGEYKVVGKTFKGLTDEEFKQMTNRLLKLRIREEKHTVNVKPEVVVEIAYNEIQKSPKYESGFALRFARVKRIRDDKPVGEVATIDDIRRLYEKQFTYKARL
jgi:DNA ligase-1